MIFIILWTTIFAFLTVYLGKSPRVRSRLKVIIRAPKLWRFTIAVVAGILAIVGAFLMIPKTEVQSTDERLLFEDYAATAIMKLDSLKALQDAGEFTEQLVLQEEYKNYPVEDVWAEFCRRALKKKPNAALQKELDAIILKGSGADMPGMEQCRLQLLKLAEKLASYGDIYCNDAFGTAHRAHASTAVIADYIQPAVSGFLLEKEK